MRPVSVTFVLLWAMAAAGQVQITAPLEGYYRPGKFMPLRVRTAVSGQLVIQPDNGANTRVMLSAGQHDFIVPLLTMGTSRQIRYRLESGSGGFADAELRPLGDDQKLVGFLGSPDVPLARSLFPGASIIPLKLSGATVLAGTAAAWNTLDAVVFDGIAPEGGRVAELVAAGITVAVRATEKPRGAWPWERVADCWVCRANPLGPRSAGENQPAFAPVSGWEADWPAPFRHRVMLYGAVFVVLAVAATLLPRRWAVLAIILISASATFAVRTWAKGHPVVLRKTGTVTVQGGLGQSDGWIWLAASNPGPASVPFDAFTLPLFQSPHWQLVGLTLTCDSTGRPLTYNLSMRPGMKVAFVSRVTILFSQRPGEPIDTLHPLRRLADRVYLRPGYDIAGHLSGPAASIYAQDWGTIFLERKGLDHD